MTFSLRTFASSDVGRIRKNNQDSGFASPQLLVVADGMGGAAAGDLASAVVIHHVAAFDEAGMSGPMEGAMRGLVEQANDHLAELIDDDPTLDGMGTTFCGAAFDGERLGVTHIGDSRGYRLRDGELEQLTHDHSWVQSLIDSGRLTPEQAAVHPHRSLILKVLNGQPTMVPDYFELEAREGDRYLFCSDGLSGLIDDDAMARILQGEDLEAVADDLTRAALRAGGHDNITVVLADVVPADEALDGAAAMQVGSVTERTIPDLDETTAASDRGFPIASTDEPIDAVDHNPIEVARYAPEDKHHRWPSLLGGTLAVVLVLALATWGVASYANSRYYIADFDGHVAIYHGLPGSLLGRELNQLQEQSATLVSDLPAFYQRAVANTIGTDGLVEAKDTTERLATLAAACVESREARATASPSPSPSHTPSPSASRTSWATSTSSPVVGDPNYPTYLAPITPTADAEADPGAC